MRSMDIVKNHYGAKRIGVEYVYTMVPRRSGHEIPELRGSRYSRSSQVNSTGGGDSPFLIHLNT